MVFETETGIRTPTTIGQIILFITFLINAWLNVKRENRHRQWQMEDAKAVREALEAQQTAVRSRLENQEKNVRKALDDQTDTLNDILTKRTNEITKRFDSLLEGDK